MGGKELTKEEQNKGWKSDDIRKWNQTKLGDHFTLLPFHIILPLQRKSGDKIKKRL